ncbi:tetratricopeptide repeat protein [Actinomadura keratinilytica]
MPALLTRTGTRATPPYSGQSTTRAPRRHGRMVPPGERGRGTSAPGPYTSGATRTTRVALEEDAPAPMAEEIAPLPEPPTPAGVLASVKIGSEWTGGGPDGRSGGAGGDPGGGRGGQGIGARVPGGARRPVGERVPDRRARPWRRGVARRRGGRGPEGDGPLPPGRRGGQPAARQDRRGRPGVEGQLPHGPRGRPRRSHGLGPVERRHPGPPARCLPPRLPAAGPRRRVGRARRRRRRPRLLPRRTRRDRPHPGRLRGRRGTPRTTAGRGPPRGEARHTVWALEGIAQMHRNTGAYDRAHALFAEAAEIAERAEDHRGWAWALRGMADVVSVRDGDVAQALSLLTRAEAACRAMDLRGALAFNHKMRGNVLYRASRYEEAHDLYTQALAEFRDMTEPRGPPSPASDWPRHAPGWVATAPRPPPNSPPCATSSTASASTTPARWWTRRRPNWAWGPCPAPGRRRPRRRPTPTAPRRCAPPTWRACDEPRRPDRAPRPRSPLAAPGRPSPGLRPTPPGPTPSSHAAGN